MDVILFQERIDLQDCDILIVGFFEDERPLRGSSGWVDWRLNGKLSGFLIQNRLTGDWKEMTLIPSYGRVPPKMILTIGLGKVREYSYIRLRELFPYLVDTLRRLQTSNICFSLPYEENYNVDCGKLAEVIIEGMADSLERYQSPSEEGWIKDLRLYFAEGEKRFPEILLGVQTAQSILEGRFKIRIFSPSDENPLDQSIEAFPKAIPLSHPIH